MPWSSDQGLDFVSTSFFRSLLVVFDRPCSFIRQYHLPFLAGILAPGLLMGLLARFHRRSWWSTIGWTFGTPIGLIVVWMLLGPTVRPPFRRALAAAAMRDMRKLAEEVEAGRTPAITLDPWCQPYVIETSGPDYAIISYGADGHRDVSSNESCVPDTTPDFRSDIVFSKGRFCVTHKN